MIVLQILGYILLSVMAAFFVYAVVVVFAPWIREPRQPLADVAASAGVGAGEETGASPSQGEEGRRDVTFARDGESIRGWFYPPDAEGPSPCIVMNNGLGGTKDLALEPFARRFAHAGFGVLTYDYRHFGESDGEPRQLLSLDKQVDDCQAAVAHTRTLPEVNANRIAIWGTSAGGGIRPGHRSAGWWDCVRFGPVHGPRSPRRGQAHPRAGGHRVHAAPPLPRPAG